MKRNLGSYPKLLILLVLPLLLSCGGGGAEFNVNFADGFPQNYDFPSVHNTNFEATDTVFHEVQPEGRTRFRLEGLGGNITITGLTGATSVQIWGTTRVMSDSTEDAAQQLRELKVNVQSLADEILVETRRPMDARGRKHAVDYTIALPTTFAIHVSNVNGVVTLASIGNDVTVHNVAGNVKLTGIAGSVTVSLVSGDIDSEAALPPKGRIDLETTTGDIRLALSVDASAIFSASVSIGTISASNLELQNEVRTATLLTGTLGSGEGTVSLQSTAVGSIDVWGA